MVSQKYGLNFEFISSGTFTGLPSLLTKTKWTWASTIVSSPFVIIWFIKKEVFVIDLTKDLTVNSSSKLAGFL